MASRFGLYLALGRVSNLPTVWTNVLAGVVLAGAPPEPLSVAALGVVLSLFYVGGMFLNDAFDRRVDALERPERPIPSGRISAGEVFAVGFALLGAGVALLGVNVVARSAPPTSVMAGLSLAGLVVLYDAWHKKNPWSPVVMGSCRAATYVTAGLAAGGALRGELVVGALALGGYVVGLTFVARQENRRSYRAGATLALLATPAALSWVVPGPGGAAWVALAAWAAWVVHAVRPLFASASPDVGRSVVRLIAGISLVDAWFLAAAGAPLLSGLAVVGLGATLALQRWVRGT